MPKPLKITGTSRVFPKSFGKSFECTITPLGGMSVHQYYGACFNETTALYQFVGEYYAGYSGVEFWRQVPSKRSQNAFADFFIDQSRRIHDDNAAF